MKKLDITKTQEQLISELEILRHKVVKLQKEKLLLSEKQSRALLMINSMYQFVGLLDIKGNILEVNQAALEAAGITYSDTIGKPFWETAWWAGSIYTQQKLKQAIKQASNGEFVRFEVEHFLGSVNNTMIVDFSLKPIFNQEGKVVYLLPEGRNITEQKQAEKEILSKNLELAKKNEELLQSYKQADRIFSAFANILPGMVLDEKYLLECKIGVGGYGIIYRAKHIHLNKSVAVKIFRPVPGNDSAESLERFKLEGMSACRINHPNAISVLDSGVSKENIAYLVMELLQGHSLSELLSKEETLSVKRCAEILIPVCEVLAEAQKAGLIHRDIKPDNIFLHQTPEGEVVKVVDFGIAKIFDNSGDLAKLTSSNGVVGTVDYVAPERFGKKPYDGQSDIYSLGVMAYQMLSGQTPFYSLNCSYIDILLAHMYDEPPSLKQNNINIPDELEALVMQALSKDPAKRPTAQEFAQKLAIIARFTPKTTSEASTNFLYSNKKVSLKTKTITIKNYNSISQNHTLSIFCKV